MLILSICQSPECGDGYAPQLFELDDYEHAHDIVKDFCEKQNIKISSEELDAIDDGEEVTVQRWIFAINITGRYMFKNGKF